MTEDGVILFVPLGVYAFDQQLATAIYLVSHSAFRPHFLLISKADHTLVGQLESAGISYSTLEPLLKPSAPPSASPLNGSRTAPSPNGRSRLARARRIARWLPGISLIRLFMLAWRLRLKKPVAKKLVNHLSPRCAVVSQERLQVFFPILKSLRELKIPIILMLTADSSPDGSAWPRRESYLLKTGLNKPSTSPEKSPYPPLVGRVIGVLNRSVARRLPSQVYDSRWGKILFYPAAQIFLMQILGMLPRNPWYQGTTFADYIMISGVDESAMYADAVVDPAKLLFFGSHELDNLYERWIDRTELRHKLLDDYQLQHGKRIVIVALPQFWEQGMFSEEAHWQSVNDILEVFPHQDCNVLISLHPRTIWDHYAWIEEKYPVKICREPLKDILVIADVFVASYSSTIRWAIGLGIPVINLDFWRLDMTQYKDLTGYQTITTAVKFGELLRRLTSASQDNRSDIKPNPDSDRTGIIVDGKAKERLVHFIESLDRDIAAPAVISEHTTAVL